MPAAQGKDAFLIDDRTGFRIKYTIAVKDWNGSWVHPSEVDGEPPNYKKRRKKGERVSLAHPRPEPTSTSIDQQLRDWMSNASQGNIPQTFGPTG